MNLLSHSLLRYICGALLVSTSFSLSASEEEIQEVNAAENVVTPYEQDQYIPAGNRFLTEEEISCYEENIPSKIEEKDDSIAVLKAIAGISKISDQVQEQKSSISDFLGTKSFIASSHHNAWHMIYLFHTLEFDYGFKKLYEYQVELGDHSIWTIDPDDMAEINHPYFAWVTFHRAYLTPNHDFFTRSSFPYRIHNYDRPGSSIAVKLTAYLRPELQNSNDHLRAMTFDNINHTVQMSDGSIWDIKPEDYVKMNWFTNDNVVVGINDSFFPSRKNILINVNTLRYVRATCLLR